MAAERRSRRVEPRVGLLVGAVLLASVATVLAALDDLDALSLAQLVSSLAAAILLALYLVVAERRRHEVVEEELSAQATFLERLVD